MTLILKDIKYEDVKPSRWYNWPLSGKVHTLYSYWMLANTIVEGLSLVARIAFEDKPNYYSVYLETCMNFVFIFDFFKNFITPFKDETTNHMEFNFKVISKHYIKSWMVFDVIAFFPVTYFRSISKYEEGTKNDLQNLLHLNFERLPKVYMLLLFLQLVRARDVGKYLKFMLSKFEMKHQSQSILMTFFTLSYILHVSGCFWYATTGATRSV